MIGSDTVRWLGTTAFAGSLALTAVVFTGILSLHGLPVPETLQSINSLAAGAFFTAFGTMIGARASNDSITRTGNVVLATNNNHEAVPTT